MTVDPTAITLYEPAPTELQRVTILRDDLLSSGKLDDAEEIEDQPIGFTAESYLSAVSASNLPMASRCILCGLAVGADFALDGVSILTIEEVAALAGCSKSTVRKHLKALAPEWLTTFPLGRRKRYFKLNAEVSAASKECPQGEDVIGYVYFASDIKAQLIKIGFTGRTVSERIRELQGGYPHQLQMLGCIVGDRADERAAHAYFAEHHFHGEWFDVPMAEAAAYIREYGILALGVAV